MRKILLTLLLIFCLSTPSYAIRIIRDLDNDTKVNTEESADEDIIRFDTAGSERMIIDSVGDVDITNTLKMGSDTAEIRLGNDEDWIIKHDGSNAYLDNNTGVMTFTSVGGYSFDDTITVNSISDTDGDTFVTMDNDGGDSDKFAAYTGGSERMEIDDSGNLGLGVAPLSYSRINLNADTLDTSFLASASKDIGSGMGDGGTGVQSTMTPYLSANSGTNSDVTNFTATTQLDTKSYDMNSRFAGLQSSVYVWDSVGGGTHTGTFLEGVMGALHTVRAGVNTTNLIGMLLYPDVDGGVTVTNYYGLYIDNDGIDGTITNNYGIYQADTTATNYFAGFTDLAGGYTSAQTMGAGGDEAHIGSVTGELDGIAQDVTVNFQVNDLTLTDGATSTNLVGVTIEDQTQGTNNTNLLLTGEEVAGAWNIYSNSTKDSLFEGDIWIDSDSKTMTFGEDQDADIYHNGTNMQIDNSTGAIFVNDDTDISGHLALGANATINSNQVANITETRTCSGASEDLTGLYVIPTMDGNGNNPDDLIGVEIVTNAGGSGDTTAEAYGIKITNQVLPTDTVTSTYGLHITMSETGGTMTTGTAIYLADGMGDPATSWAIYQADVNADNLFEGELSIDGDSQKLRLGEDQDFDLYSDGSDSYIDSNTGDLKFIAAGGDANFADDNITTTGDMIIDSDSGSLTLGDGQDADLLFNGTNMIIKSGSGDMNTIISKETTSFATSYALSLQSNNASTYLEILNNGGAGVGGFFGMNGNNFEIWSYQSGTMDFYMNDTLDMQIEADGDVNHYANDITTTGLMNLGGGSLEIPQNNTPDAVGEISIDTTDDQLMYYGGANRVIPYEYTFCKNIENLAAADDNMPFFSPQDNITLVKAWCHCSGTCTTEADLTFETIQIGGGGTDNVGGTVDCEDTTAGDSATSLTADNTVDGLDLILFDVDNAVSPESDTYTVCLVYTVDAQ